ncbi:SAM-dependent methyltransferase [Ciceribacter ferrooxidans]|uniref:Class I SAM-dependent methyltransferase n=1 Tax=Ciceribacter ferrooxidans TaxID=2509717 RepID=A0A4V1RQ71_9HYPH|nr:class I SAM-dependent methyltransferase [Ciceribacter ferrooxidans]RYC11837.1 class I SAM-dependent methyltransferase [Ciceribacter ferrooxidans]
MAAKASQRHVEIADALPLTSGMRILEIGCGPGVLARLIAERLSGACFILGIDRSAKAVDAARASLAAFTFPNALSFRQASAEEFALGDGEDPFDLAVAIRVGALDGRHPEAGEQALKRIAAALAPHGRLFIDGGKPLKELALPSA